MDQASEAPPSYRLEDRYLKRSGRVFMTGTQALVRIVLDQARRDREAGLRTAGFVSGYRGSPLGGVDMELWRCKKLLDEAGIEFLPAVNEDLAATAVLGSQQVETHPDRKVQGCSASGTARDPASTARAMRSSTETLTGRRRTAVCWLSQATTTAACRRRCRTSRMWPS